MLATLLQTDLVSSEILRFLVANENAMDSLKGIAAWWVCRDELAVQPSLQRLFALGAIVAHSLSSGTTVYGLTQDPSFRALIREVVGNTSDPSAVSGSVRRGIQNPSNLRDFSI